jgi:hypothetical protein
VSIYMDERRKHIEEVAALLIDPSFPQSSLKVA